MALLKCCMCTEECEGYDSMLVHMTKYHQLNFADKDDMNRRLQAIGFDPIKEPEQTQVMRPLYG